MKCILLVLSIIFTMNPAIVIAEPLRSLINKVHTELGGADGARIPSVIIYNSEKQQFLDKLAAGEYLNLSSDEKMSETFSKYFINLPKKNITLEKLREYIPDIDECKSYCILYISIPKGNNLIRETLLRIPEIERMMSEFLSRRKNAKLFVMYE